MTNKIVLPATLTVSYDVVTDDSIPMGYNNIARVEYTLKFGEYPIKRWKITDQDTIERIYYYDEDLQEEAERFVATQLALLWFGGKDE